MKKRIIGCLAVSAFAVSLVTADTIVEPTSVTSTVAGDVESSVNYLINDNANLAGYSLHTTNNTEVVLHTGDTLDLLNTVACHAGNGHKESWTAETSAGTPVFVFDLGADSSISSTVLWQYGNWGGNLAHAGENDVQDFRMIFHTAAEGNTFDFTTETADLDTTALRMQNREINGNVAQQFTFGVTTARYVAMRIDSNYGGGRNGLGEVTFAIPEPATFGMIAVMAGGLLFVRRRLMV